MVKRILTRQQLHLKIYDISADVIEGQMQNAERPVKCHI